MAAESLCGAVCLGEWLDRKDDPRRQKHSLTFTNHEEILLGPDSDLFCISLLFFPISLLLPPFIANHWFRLENSYFAIAHFFLS